MGATYTRQSSAGITDGAVIEASDINDEFDQLLAAFVAASGHTHDGTAAEGGPVAKLLGTSITIGDGTAGTDITVTFDGESNDGVLYWMEDEDHFKFADDIVVDSTKKLYFYDEGGEYISGDGTDLTLTSGADINIPSNIGLTFGNDGEKIEGDGTDLTITGNTINLTATTDVALAANTGLLLAGTEKIESDGTDLSITVGAGGDINIGSDIGLTFGNDGEKIEGDGTDLTISSSALANIDAGTDIVLDADGGDIFFKDNGTTFGSATNTSGNLIIKSGTTTAATFSGANVTLAGTVGSGAITSTGTVQGTTITATTAFVPDASDGAALGTAALEFSDLFLADSAVLNFGDDQDTTLTHTDGTGLTLNSTNKLCFNDSSQFLQGSSATVLSIGATDEIDLTATAIDINGTADISGTLTLGTVAAAGTDTDKFLVLDGSGNVDYRTGTQVASDIGASTAITALNSATANELVTVGSTTTELDAETNLTFDGTTLTATALTVDDVAVDGKVVTMTGSTSDTAVLTAGTNGTLSIVTTDAAAAAANIQITADGTVDIDSAGVLTLDSGAAINIEPASGSAILLDGTISVDAGVVTGATSITSTAFVGTLSTAAQGNVTSLGTLTTLTVDNVIVNGTTIGHTSDTDLLTLTSGVLTVAGEVSATTLDIGGTNISSTAAELNILDGVTATAAELNYSDLATLGTSAASKVLSADANNLTKISGGIYIEEATLTFDATQDWDVRASPVAKVTLTANTTFDAPSNPTTGQFISIVCIQDGTGSRTIAWNGVFEFTADTAPTATTTASRGDMFNFRYNGTKWLEVGRNLNLVLS